METVIDQAGRIVLPKPIRDALGLLPGTKVDISPYGAGAQVVPAGRTARLVEEDGVLVSAGDTPVDDGVVFALIDAGRDKHAVLLDQPRRPARRHYLRAGAIR